MLMSSRAWGDVHLNCRVNAKMRQHYRHMTG
jgi:hypothetical protein